MALVVPNTIIPTVDIRSAPVVDIRLGPERKSEEFKGEIAFNDIKKCYEQGIYPHCSVNMNRDSVHKICMIAKEAYKTRQLEEGETVLHNNKKVFLVRLKKDDPLLDGLPEMDIFFEGNKEQRIYLKETPIVTKGGDKEFSPEFLLKATDFEFPTGHCVAGLRLHTLIPSRVASHKEEIAILQRLQGTPWARYFPIPYNDFHTDSESMHKQELGFITLFQFLQNEKMSFTDDGVLVSNIAKGLFNQLKGMESIGVIHGDIKLENLLMNDDICLLTDFGRANSASTTCFLVSPERWKESLENKPMSELQRKDDIWAAGLVLVAFTSKGGCSSPQWQKLLMLKEYINNFNYRRNNMPAESKEEVKVSAAELHVIASLETFNDIVLQPMSPVEMATLYSNEKVKRDCFNDLKIILESITPTDQAISVVNKIDRTLTDLINRTFVELETVVNTPIEIDETEDPIFRMIREMAYAMLQPDPSKRANMDKIREFAVRLESMDSYETKSEHKETDATSDDANEVTEKP